MTPMKWAEGVAFDHFYGERFHGEEQSYESLVNGIRAAIEIAVEEEREACARVAETIYAEERWGTAWHVALSIRARSRVQP